MNTMSPGSDGMSIEDAIARAHAHWNAGQADQAELFCQRVLAAWPGHSDALHLMGIMAHAYGNLDLAIQHVSQACQAPRAPAGYYSNLAEMYRQKGMLAEGEQAARRAVALDAKLVAGWNNLGILLQEAGKLEESRSCLQTVISLVPDYAEGHNNLANTYKRLGQLDQAEFHYGEAFARHPNYAEAFSNLANLLNDRGRLDEAADAARRAIEINPQFADAYINLAAIERTRDRHAEALRWLDALLSFAPRHPAGLSARALALKQMEQLEPALDSARRAVEIAPGNAEARNALGQILQAAGHLDEALDEFDRAASLPGLAAESALSNRAVLFMETGRKNEALAAFARALQAFPNSAQALFNQADLKKFAAGDPEIARMEAMLGQTGSHSHSDRLSLHFALGKAYLDSGEDDRAFQHFGEGNRMKRSSISYDADATEHWMQDIARTFSPALLKKFAGAGTPSALPVFVLGIPRSGTTLIEQILASHPLVKGAGELSAMQRVADSIGLYPAGAAKLTTKDFARLGRDYLAAVSPLADGARHVVDKMPANFLHAGLISLALPEARIIHCRRDPVDTCLSCYTKLFTAEQLFTYDLTELGHFHRSYQALMAHWRATLPADRFIEVDYEAVVDDLEGQARRLIDFLGLTWDEACLRFHETGRTVRTASVNQVRQPIYRSSKGRWKRHADHLGPLLAALGVEA